MSENNESLENKKSISDSAKEKTTEFVNDAKEAFGDIKEKLDETLSEENIENLKNKASEYSEIAKEKAGEFAHEAKETFEDLKENASEIAGEAAEHLADFAEEAKEDIKEASGKAKNFFQRLFGK